MKNIHVLPTDKPSRLLIDTIENKLYYQPILHNKTVNVLTQHIYIISDEEIKEGDWILVPSTDGETYFDFRESVPKKAKWDYASSKFVFKIILTTDQDLIKDNVQSIDNEFLEWFVKNPSCEKVEVYEVNGKLFAEPIIPKEEPKQELHICKYCGAETNQLDDECYAKPKKETLEEVALKYASEKLDRLIIPYKELNANVAEYVGFINGAKWQAERMFSEEDLINAYRWGTHVNHGTKEHFNEYLEQFKKK